MGQEFIFAFPTPRYTGGIPYVMITTTSSSPIHVNTSVPGVGFTNSIVVSRHVLGNVSLPTSAYPSGDGKYNRSIIIRAGGDVSVYGMYGYHSYRSYEQAAGFLVMPTSMLGKKYIVASYALHHYSNPAEITVTALNHQTHIKVDIKIGGADQEFVLQPYESCQVSSEIDLTGSIIVADQPVSVMSGMKCANIPVHKSNCEYIAIHLIDVKSYRTHFVLFPFPGQSSNYIFRVIAAERSTKLHIFGIQSEQLVIDLESGRFYEGNSDDIMYISSNKPVMVVHYAQGSTVDSYADPSMIFVPPVSSFASSVVFPVTTLPARAPQQTYIIVIILCKYSDNILVDGEYTEWSDILTTSITGLESQFCVHRKAVLPGVHSVSRFPEEGHFSVIVHGVSIYSSYAYPAILGNPPNDVGEVTVEENGKTFINRNIDL